MHVFSRTIFLGIFIIGVGHCIQGLVNPVAFYPLDSKHEASDISCHDNKKGIIVGAKLTEGPKGTPNTGYEFAAAPNNYIEIPGTQYTDTRYSITILAWIYHSGSSGPIVDYATDGFGVNLWMTGKDALYGGIISREKSSSYFLSSNQVGLQYSWHYVGLSYDYSEGVAVLWVDGVKVQKTLIGRIELKTAGVIRLGALSTDDRYFRGKISCLQIYDEALKESEILQARNRCTKQVLDCSATSKVECGGDMSMSTGTITSPRYPREYPPNADCVWKLSIPKGKRIAIRFSKIDLEEDVYSCGDYIEVFDGLNSWSTRLVKYCKTPRDGKMNFVSKSNTMRIEFKSNGNTNGKGFQAYYKSEDIAKEDDKETLDLSVHYTGIVIGVACAALFAALTIIAINHTKQSRRRRSSTISSARPRRSESFSATDIIVQGAPPSYDVVMRCPDLYPPSPQMSPATSVISTLGNPRFGGLRHGPSPLSTRTINSSLSQRFNKQPSNGLSEDSDEEDPPPYPGMETTAQIRCQSHDLPHDDQSNISNSTNGNSLHQLNQTPNSTSISSLAIDNTGSQDSSTRDPFGSSPPCDPCTSPSLCLSELGTDIDSNNEGETHVTIHNNDEHGNEAHGNEMPDSSHQTAAVGSDVSVTIATSDGSIAKEQSKTDDVENDKMRNRLDSQNSIVGTVV